MNLFKYLNECLRKYPEFCHSGGLNTNGNLYIELSYNGIDKKYNINQFKNDDSLIKRIKKDLGL